MKEFTNKVAVITGAASGIGRGIANRAVKEGMKVVLADIEKEALKLTEEELKKSGADIISVLIDVSKPKDMENLAQKTIDTFGEVHLLCNNAGVAVPGYMWEYTLTDWEWVMGVNLWGVIHGIRVFTPIMLKQDIKCHIINTASIEGLISGVTESGIYSSTKHAVVALSEALRTNLMRINSKLKVSVLCPGFVNTKITDCERNRPAELCGPDFEPRIEKFVRNHPEIENFVEQFKKTFEYSNSPDKVANIVFEAIKNELFYIFTDSGLMWKNLIKTRMEEILKAFDENKPIIKSL
ncbi:MAG: SDR family NAD(P)-dependent oxidoreductase [Promethearchaeota archaeon]